LKLALENVNLLGDILELFSRKDSGVRNLVSGAIRFADRSANSYRNTCEATFLCHFRIFLSREFNGIVRALTYYVN
jgi:hypothetical protein